MEYPRLHLSIDNCFASKRWTKPKEWMAVVRDLGLNFAEASADNECDPLYTGPAYLKQWADEVGRASQQTGVAVSGLYSGHGTYATLGLAHTSGLVRGRLREEWLKPMIDLAAELGTGLGCYCFAFSDSVLQDGELYQAYYDRLCQDLALVCGYAKTQCLRFFAIEQMYSPHQVPFTLVGAGEMLRRVSMLAESPLYITVDTGHQVGQRRFLRPRDAELAERVRTGEPGWLGPLAAYRTFASSDLPKDKIQNIRRAMDGAPWMFAGPNDSDTALWLRQLGMYSPIIHLQQTDGVHSAHWPFTRHYNSIGQVKGKTLLEALMQGAQDTPVEGMPPRVADIYLTLDIFSGTAAYNYDILRDLRESVAYWRQFVPHDGITLDEAWHRLERSGAAECSA